MNMKNDPTMDGVEIGGGALAKIEALKTQFIGALDELAAEIGGEEATEPEMPEEELPEGETAPVAVEEKKMVFGKKKPGNAITQGLGI